MDRKLGGLIALLAIAVSVPSNAQEASEEPTTEQRPSYCAQSARTARSLMQVRQAGKPLEEVLGTLDGMSAGTQKRWTRLAIAAYERPRYMTGPMVQREVDDFSNEVHLACLKAAG